MKRMKSILIYVLLIVAFYIFSNFVIYASIHLGYQNIEKGEIVKGDPSITVMDAKATSANGYIKMQVTNEQDSTLTKYIQIDLLSKNDNILATKALPVDAIQPNETRQMELKFNINKVKGFKIQTVDTMPHTEKTEQEKRDDAFYDMVLLTSGILLFPVIVSTFIP